MFMCRVTCGNFLSFVSQCALLLGSSPLFTTECRSVPTACLCEGFAVLFVIEYHVTQPWGLCCHTWNSVLSLDWSSSPFLHQRVSYGISIQYLVKYVSTPLSSPPLQVITLSNHKFFPVMLLNLTLPFKTLGSVQLKEASYAHQSCIESKIQ